MCLGPKFNSGCACASDNLLEDIGMSAEVCGGMHTCTDLDPASVEIARAEEMAFMQRLGVFALSSREECMAKTLRPPVATRWVDIDEGKNGLADVWSRLVARASRGTGSLRSCRVHAAVRGKVVIVQDGRRFHEQGR